MVVAVVRPVVVVAVRRLAAGLRLAAARPPAAGLRLVAARRLVAAEQQAEEAAVELRQAAAPVARMRGTNQMRGREIRTLVPAEAMSGSAARAAALARPALRARLRSFCSGSPRFADVE